MSHPRSQRTDDACTIFEAAVRAVQADALLSGFNIDQIAPRPLSDYRRLFVVGMGKASLAMASMAEHLLGKLIHKGYVVVPEGYPASLPSRFSAPRLIQIAEGGHPVPTEGSRRAARRILELADAATEEDLFLALISGGGSALAADFQGNIGLSDASEAFGLMLRAGLDIHEMNAVRKHLSAIGGGRLARTAHPADVVALVISDVVGDDLNVIASGPTVADPTTFGDALDVLRRHNLLDSIPASIRAHLERGLREPDLETTKPGSSSLENVRTLLLGTNATALNAAGEAARLKGYGVVTLPAACTGEAREAATSLVNEALRHKGEDPVCVLSGGETTVSVRGRGRGGRNQELALAAAIELRREDHDVVLLSAGTDGVDGPTDAAGAFSTPETISLGRRKGLDAHSYLRENDSYTFFEGVGGLLKTGHTHTNVMDVQVVLIARKN